MLLSPSRDVLARPTAHVGSLPQSQPLADHLEQNQHVHQPQPLAAAARTDTPFQIPIPNPTDGDPSCPKTTHVYPSSSLAIHQQNSAQPPPPILSLSPRSILKPSPPFSSHSHSPPPIPPPLPSTPLPRPWTFPPNALYTEPSLDTLPALIHLAITTHFLSHQRARCLSAQEAVCLLVSSGVLVVEQAGIRRAHDAQYVLVYSGQREDNAREYVPTIRRWQPVGTPIVERKSDGCDGEGGRRVRFLRVCECWSSEGLGSEERVKEGDGEMGKYDGRWLEDEGRVREK